MATLKNLQDSMGNDGSALETAVAQPFTIEPTQIIDAPVGVQTYVIFRLVRKKQRRLRIDGICDNVMNPKTKRRERIWLLRGADSIWQTELTDLLKDKEYVGKNRMSILFEDGICRIPTDDEKQLEFARRNVHNVGKNRTGSGKYDYYEYDAMEEQKLRLEKQTRRINMVIKAKEMPVDKMKKLAAFMGISFVDELGQAKGDDGIRAELMLNADSRSELFERYIDSKEVDISWMVRRAIIEAKIDLTGQAGNALWANGKGFIAKIPKDRKAYEYLTELAMTNSDEGRQFLDQLNTYA